VYFLVSSEGFASIHSGNIKFTQTTPFNGKYCGTSLGSAKKEGKAWI
jgi:hypothetical protein